MLENLTEYFCTDTSLEDFYTNLLHEINASPIQNSFIDYHFPKLHFKNKLYQKIEAYTKGTVFYTKFTTDNPEINIKRIGEIKLHENCYTKGLGGLS